MAFFIIPHRADSIVGSAFPVTPTITKVGGGRSRQRAMKPKREEANAKSNSGRVAIRGACKERLYAKCDFSDSKNRRMRSECLVDIKATRNQRTSSSFFFLSGRQCRFCRDTLCTNSLYRMSNAPRCESSRSPPSAPPSRRLSAAERAYYDK